jgi:hypothetical protein
MQDSMEILHISLKKWGRKGGKYDEHLWKIPNTHCNKTW